MRQESDKPESSLDIFASPAPEAGSLLFSSMLIQLGSHAECLLECFAVGLGVSTGRQPFE